MFKIKKRTSPKTPDTVKRPYQDNDTDLWDRGSMHIIKFYVNSHANRMSYMRFIKEVGKNS